MDTPGTPAKPSSRTWVYFLIGAVVIVGVVLVIMKQSGSQQSGKAGLRPVASTTCTDSDGGSVTTVAGTVTIGKRTVEDTCVDATRVREAFCLEGKLKRSTYGD